MTDELQLYGNVEPMLALARTLKGAVGLIPDHLKTEGQILATMLAGRELGLGPMAAMRGLHVVKGKVGADYSLWVALLKRNGYTVEWPASGPERVELRLTDPKGIKHTEVWDKQRAQQAGLWGQGMGWAKYPETMLRARAVTSAGRAFAAEVMAGGYSLDEVEEIRQSAKAAPLTRVRVVHEPHPTYGERLEDAYGVDGPDDTLPNPEVPDLPITHSNVDDSGQKKRAKRKPNPRAVAEKEARMDDKTTDPDDVPMELDVPTIIGGMRECRTVAAYMKWANEVRYLKQAEKDLVKEEYDVGFEKVKGIELADKEASKAAASASERGEAT